MTPVDFKLSDLPEHFHFVSGKLDTHEWEMDVDTGQVTYKSDPGVFNVLECLEDFHKALHPEDREAASRITDCMLQEPGLYRYECRLVIHKDEVRWVSMNVRTVAELGRVTRLYGQARDITERKRSQAVAHGQRRALEFAMSGASLESIFELVCRLVEEQAGGMHLASIMLLDAQGYLRHCAAPSLPPDYIKSIDGIPIGPDSGSCGSAAFTCEPIIVTDIEQDWRWRAFHHLAVPHGLRACWSVPLLSSKGDVQGTMALYSREKRGPTAWELDSVKLLANTASLIIERYMETQERSRAESRFRSLVRATSALIWSTSSTGEVNSPLPELSDFTGLATEQMQGFGWMRAIHPEDMHIINALVRQMFFEAKPLQVEVRLKRADGEYRDMDLHAVPIFDANGKLIEWAGSYTDITDRMQSQKQLRHLATHDALTGLPNRTYLNEHLQELLNFSGQASKLAVMLIDLDRFKHINDSMGHGAGDVLLRSIAQRLRSSLPAGDLIARLGGDEFVVVAHTADGRASANRIAQMLVKALSAPVDIDGTTMYSGASLGLCLYPDHGQSADILIQNADIAMYRAKAEGGNGYCFFSQEMSDAMKHRMGLELALRGALERNEFLLHYQPRISLPEMKLKGVEALIRWNSPANGLVSPLEFIPIAEETGLINAIGAWVLRQACADIQKLGAAVGYPVHLSVNLSPNQLLCPHLTDDVSKALSTNNMRPEYLELELTEGSFIHDMETSTFVMRRLRSLGVQLAVDDFGTGHAGIEYLRQFPIDVVKLDRTFVAPIALEDHGFSFLKALTDMAHALKMHVVAEGVEDAQTLDLLCKAHCDEAQGYLFAKPLPLAELLDNAGSYAKKADS